VGLMTRMGMVLKAKMNALVEGSENPAETLEYSYQKQLEMLQKVKRGIVEVVTSKRRVEMQAEADAVAWVAVGVGVNVANRLPASLHGTAVTLSDLCGESRPGRAALLRTVLERLRIRLAEVEHPAGREAVCRAARRLSVLDGARVTVRGPGSTRRGMVEGIRDDGALLLRRSDGVLEPVLAGDVLV